MTSSPTLEPRNVLYSLRGVFDLKQTLIALVLCAASPFAVGQAPQQPLPNMQAIAEALGVPCEYCHSAARGSGLPEPRKDIARQMLAMTRELNTRVETAPGNSTGQAG